MANAIRACLVTFSMVFPGIAAAGGIAHVYPPSVENRTFAVARLQIVLSKTLVTVSDAQVSFRFDQTFFNDNDFPLEGLFVLPLQAGKELLELDVKINGMPAPFQVVGPEDFFPTMRQLTVNIKDPALLGLAGKTVLLVRPVHFGIREQKAIRVTYKNPLSLENNVLDLHVPLDGERFALGPVGVFEVNVRFNGSRVVRTLFSYTHHLSVLREAPHRCMASARQDRMRVRHDFCLLAAFSGQDLNFRLLPQTSPGEKGAFIGFIEPPLVKRPAAEPEKDIVFILDASGSMNNANVDLAKHAITFGLEKLRPGDRFNVLIMKTHPERLAPRLLPASRQNVLDAVNLVNAARAEGGTDLYNSFMNALEQFRSRRRPCNVVFVGHGRGTVGITEPETVVDHVRRGNKVRARIFTLALGDRADIAVLNTLAGTNGGSCIHFSGKGDFSAAVSRLFARVAPPSVSGLSLEFQDIIPEGVCPDPIPDLFGSEGIVVLGRYEGKTEAVVRARLRGRVPGRNNAVTKNYTFQALDHAHPYVPALWAMRRVGRLMEKEWFKGPEPESRQQIQALAKEFGFKLPFSAESGASVLHPPTTSKDAAELYWLFKTSLVIADVESDRCRRVANKVFCLDKRVWIDNQYRPSLPRTEVRFLSDEYFSLIKERPILGSYLALGTDVTVVWDKTAIVVTAPGASVLAH